MPVILSGDLEKVWLESDATDVANLKSILKPYPAEEMDSKPGIGPHNDNNQKSE
jgi:putative SOS response-associated peptidase YedK